MPTPPGNWAAHVFRTLCSLHNKFKNHTLDQDQDCNVCVSHLGSDSVPECARLLSKRRLLCIPYLMQMCMGAFAWALFKTSPQDTLPFLFHNGAPVDPLKMTSIMKDTLRHYGLQTNMAELRHAFDAFGHKLGKPGWQLRDPVLSRLCGES